MAQTLGDKQYRELLLLRTALRRFLHESASAAQRVGLTASQHQLLLAIRGHDEPEGPTMGDAAAYLLLRHHSAVELVDRAVAAGLVARHADKQDARVVRLSLTRSGRHALDRLGSANLAELNQLTTHFRSFLRASDATIQKGDGAKRERGATARRASAVLPSKTTTRRRATS